MSVTIQYGCGCKYFHGDDDVIGILHACTDHKIILYSDALSNASKRVKLGTSGVIGKK